jgi:cell division protein FtsQ
MKDKYIGDDVENEMVIQILDFLQKLDAVALEKLSEVAIISADYIVAYTATEKSVQIRIGKLDERTDEKVHLIQDFLLDLENNPHDVEYVDFSYTAPFIKLAK